LLARERFSISELVVRTHVPPATIHHYLRLGLLPPARRLAANRFLYDERHVRSLKLIRVLRERRRLPLRVIRRVLPDLLGLDQDQAFRPEMWDQAVGAHVGRGTRRPPAARLLDAAIEAFARRGYADVNVDDICRAARIAKGSFYRHYHSKEELFLAATESLADEVVALFRRAAGQKGIHSEQAAPLLAGFLEPRLPLYLELLARSLQDRHGYREAARRIFGSLAADIGQSVTGLGSPQERGMQVVGAAATIILNQALAPASLEPGQPRQRAVLRAVPAVPATS